MVTERKDESKRAYQPAQSGLALIANMILEVDEQMERLTPPNDRWRPIMERRAVWLTYRVIAAFLDNENSVGDAIHSSLKRTYELSNCLGSGPSGQRATA